MKALEGKKNKGGRPKKYVDLEKVTTFATGLMTHEEIASRLDISVDTLTRCSGFADAYKKGFASATGSLRAKQFHLAMSGDRVMLIWLGKQYLGQKDIVTTEHTGEMTINDADARKQIIGRIASLAAKQDEGEGAQLPN
jgi:hypothetical protein